MNISFRVQHFTNNLIMGKLLNYWENHAALKKPPSPLCKRNRENKGLSLRVRPPCPRYLDVSCSQCRHGKRPCEASAGEEMRTRRKKRDRNSSQKKNSDQIKEVAIQSLLQSVIHTNVHTYIYSWKE